MAKRKRAEAVPQAQSITEVQREVTTEGMAKRKRAEAVPQAQSITEVQRKVTTEVQDIIATLEDLVNPALGYLVRHARPAVEDVEDKLNVLKASVTKLEEAWQGRKSAMEKEQEQLAVMFEPLELRWKDGRLDGQDKALAIVKERQQHVLARAQERPPDAGKFEKVVADFVRINRHNRHKTFYVCPCGEKQPDYNKKRMDRHRNKHSGKTGHTYTYEGRGTKGWIASS